MRLLDSLGDPYVAESLNKGGVGVIRTDTLYGIVAKASSQSAVSRIYEVKGRTPSKPPIVLIASTEQMFNPAPETYADFLNKVWPGANSVIIPTPDAPDWIERGRGTVAYRIPDNLGLVNLISQTGPLVAPSANLEGESPALTIEQAIQYFDDRVDFYVDGGKVESNTPSSLYSISDTGNIERLR